MNDTMSPNDALALFGLPKHFSSEILKDRYNRLVKENHPDLGGNPETLRLIIEAYDALCNLPPSPETFKTTVYISPKELKDYLGEKMYIQTDKYQFDIFIPYETRIGDTIKIHHILPNLTLLVKIKDKNEQPT